MSPAPKEGHLLRGRQQPSITVGSRSQIPEPKLEPHSNPEARPLPGPESVPAVESESESESQPHSQPEPKPVRKPERKPEPVSPGQTIPRYFGSFDSSNAASEVAFGAHVSRQGSTNSRTSLVRSNRESEMDVFKSEVRLLYLRQVQLEKRWADDVAPEGVLLKSSRGNYICQPRDLPTRSGGFYQEMRKLNVKVAMTVRTPMIQMFLDTCKLKYMPYIHGQKIGIIDTINGLAPVHRHHYAVFVRDPGMLVVWDEEPTEIVNRATGLEKYLVDMSWARHLEDESGLQFDVLNTAIGEAPNSQEATPQVTNTTIADERGQSGDDPRPTMLWQPLVVGCTGILTIYCLSTGWRAIAVEIKYDHSWTRLALVIVTPLQLWLGWFFFMTVVSIVAQMFGPVRQVAHNSKFYSAVPSKRLKDNFPHVTIQCPVYKEGLEAVIKPTMASVRKAISTYELQGGTANIFINDDGMQLISDEDARKRVEFYEDNNIGWVARPKHAPKGDANGQNVFIRAGKFKKASNMNYCLNVSTRLEDKLVEVERRPSWNQADEERLYASCFKQVILEDQGRTWGAGNIRIGDYILLIDSDTRVPEDCLLDAVSEMATPEVAIIQFSSGVLNVTTSFFERAITFFTNLVYTSIRFAVASGDVAPFVGHNALLRWTAVQDIRYTDKDGVEKYWAENTVSEDFDMALRLQSLGYIIRYSTYCGDEFKEGVSLTVYDELERWEKYAYGCAELLFHPFYKWPVRGPFTPLFRRFITSRINWTGKLTIMSYVGTYFAIGSAWIVTLLNYFLIGWFNGHLDKDYEESFNLYFGLVVVFQGAATVSLAVLRYRTEDRSLLSSLAEGMTWMLVLTMFIGGLSLHLSGALIRYLLGIDMSWGATAKEATDTSFFREIPVIIKKFKYTFIYCILSIAMILTLAGIGPLGALVPHDWRINSFIALYPQLILVAMHFLCPLILNPGLMHFTF
ncbi:hypothetical protein A1O1_09272 [Capronia coronata CBS 617.96]|uniref:Uncharacterized protein n=1 Tax=Capronia coronata CBS 617.96 TaxID=1182541 RepID=W9XNJ0_9EURO|nr:uncharacterized protein A1O1_09272 [Capronia coronata CBS 617.96]EXJ78870.1 hypothetical protein A1O1_09272 [Capronia coronata CBS 617.96]